jgi:[ribosomal protein S5]-alanine N-acetyltransferase
VVTPSPRVLIRAPRLADEAEVLSIRHRSREWLEKWEPNPPAGRDLFSTDGYAAWVEQARTDQRRRFLVCKAADGVVMGQVSLSEIMRGPLQQAFLGYWIAEEFAGKGYMTEALVLALRVAFLGLGLHRVEANIQPGNTASIALVKKIGFRKEGFSPGYLEIRGQWSDHERWAILAEEFLERHGTLAR